MASLDESVELEEERLGPESPFAVDGDAFEAEEDESTTRDNPLLSSSLDPILTEEMVASPSLDSPFASSVRDDREGEPPVDFSAEDMVEREPTLEPTMQEVAGPSAGPRLEAAEPVALGLENGDPSAASTEAFSDLPDLDIGLGEIDLEAAVSEGLGEFQSESFEPAPDSAGLGKFQLDDGDLANEGGVTAREPAGQQDERSAAAVDMDLGEFQLDGDELGAIGELGDLGDFGQFDALGEADVSPSAPAASLQDSGEAFVLEGDRSLPDFDAEVDTEPQDESDPTWVAAGQPDIPVGAGGGDSFDFDALDEAGFAEEEFLSESVDTSWSNGVAREDSSPPDRFDRFIDDGFGSFGDPIPGNSEELTGSLDFPLDSPDFSSPRLVFCDSDGDRAAIGQQQRLGDSR